MPEMTLAFIVFVLHVIHAQPTIEDVRAWARACLDVQGVRAEWRVQSPLWTSADATERRRDFYSDYVTEYRWPDCFTRDVINVDEHAGIRGRPDTEHSEVISPDGIRTYLSVPERSDQAPRQAWLSDRATRECFYAAYLLGCWLANQPERLDDLEVASQSPGEITIRIKAPPQLVTFKGDSADSLGMSRIEVFSESSGDSLFAYEFDDLRPVPGLPGRQGFQRRLFTKAMGSEWRNDKVDHVVSFTVHPRLEDSAFQPSQTMIAHRYPGIVPAVPSSSTSAAASPAAVISIPVIPPPDADTTREGRKASPALPPRSDTPSSNAPTWLWWAGAACAVVGIGWLVRRRLAAA